MHCQWCVTRSHDLCARVVNAWHDAPPCARAGNLKYFYGIIVTGYAGMLTCGASVIATASVRWGWQGALATTGGFMLSLLLIYKGGMRAMERLGKGPPRGSSSSAPWLSGALSGVSLLKYKPEPTLQGSQTA